MATLHRLHPHNPQTRALEKLAADLRGGAVMLYPTDTVYAIGCDLQSKTAVERVRQIKQLSNDKPLTFLCPSLSNVAHYAQVSNSAYRLMKNLIPGPYTFLLPATKWVPRLVMNPKRKTTGIRVPHHPICTALLETLGNPIISTSAYLPREEEEEGETAPPMVEISSPIAQADLFDRWDRQVDILVDDGSEPGYQVSTIVDLTTEEPQLLRKGLGWEKVTPWVG